MTGGLEGPLALAAGAATLFVIANAQNIVTLQFRGQTETTTLIGAAVRLYSEHMWAIAALVLFTTVVCPMAQLFAMCYLLAPLNRGVVPPGFARVLRLLVAVMPWGMLEVFVLGSVVSLAKLASVATVVPGLGLWTFGALVVLIAGASTSFDPDQLWWQVEALRAEHRSRASEVGR